MKPLLAIVPEETFGVTPLLIAVAVILLAFIASAIFIYSVRRN